MSAGFMAKCGTKIRHATQEAAEGQRRNLIRAGMWRAETSNTYRCNVCGHFHAGRLGKNNRGKGKRISRKPVYPCQ